MVFVQFPTIAGENPCTTVHHFSSIKIPFPNVIIESIYRVGGGWEKKNKSSRKKEQARIHCKRKVEYDRAKNAS